MKKQSNEETEELVKDIFDDSLDVAAREYDKNQMFHLLEANDKTAFKQGAKCRKPKYECITPIYFGGNFYK